LFFSYDYFIVGNAAIFYKDMKINYELKIKGEKLRVKGEGELRIKREAIRILRYCIVLVIFVELGFSFSNSLTSFFWGTLTAPIFYIP
jgi:hypothetical protein